MGGGLESRCVGRVYGADGAVEIFKTYFETVRLLVYLRNQTCNR